MYVTLVRGGGVIEILRYPRLKFGEPAGDRANSSHLLSNS